MNYNEVAVRKTTRIEIELVGVARLCAYDKVVEVERGVIAVHLREVEVLVGQVGDVLSGRNARERELAFVVAHPAVSVELVVL